MENALQTGELVWQNIGKLPRVTAKGGLTEHARHEKESLEFLFNSHEAMAPVCLTSRGKPKEPRNSWHQWPGCIVCASKPMAAHPCDSVGASCLLRPSLAHHPVPRRTCLSKVLSATIQWGSLAWRMRLKHKKIKDPQSEGFRIDFSDQPGQSGIPTSKKALLQAPPPKKKKENQKRGGRNGLQFASQAQRLLDDHVEAALVEPHFAGVPPGPLQLRELPPLQADRLPGGKKKIGRGIQQRSRQKQQKQKAWKGA